MPRVYKQYLLTILLVFLVLNLAVVKADCGENVSTVTVTEGNTTSVVTTETISTGDDFIPVTLTTNNEASNQRTSVVKIFEVPESNKSKVSASISVQFETFDTTGHLVKFVISPLTDDLTPSCGSIINTTVPAVTDVNNPTIIDVNKDLSISGGLEDAIFFDLQGLAFGGPEQGLFAFNAEVDLLPGRKYEATFSNIADRGGSLIDIPALVKVILDRNSDASPEADPKLVHSASDADLKEAALIFNASNKLSKGAFVESEAGEARTIQVFTDALSPTYPLSLDEITDFTDAADFGSEDEVANMPTQNRMTLRLTCYHPDGTNAKPQKMSFEYTVTQAPSGIDTGLIAYTTTDLESFEDTSDFTLNCTKDGFDNERSLLLSLDGQLELKQKGILDFSLLIKENINENIAGFVDLPISFAIESLEAAPDEVSEFALPIDTDIQHRRKPFRSVGVRETVLYIIDETGQSIFSPDSNFWAAKTLIDNYTVEVYDGDDTADSLDDSDIAGPIDEFDIVNGINHAMDVAIDLGFAKFNHVKAAKKTDRLRNPNFIPYIDRIGGSLAISTDCHRVPQVSDDTTKNTKFKLSRDKAKEFKFRMDRHPARWNKILKKLSNFHFKNISNFGIPLSFPDDTNLTCGPGRNFNSNPFVIKDSFLKKIFRKRKTRATPIDVLRDPSNLEGYNAANKEVLMPERIIFIADLKILENQINDAAELGLSPLPTTMLFMTADDFCSGAFGFKCE